MSRAPAPPANFESPWHGQVFALAVALNEAGHFSWSDWTAQFSATLSEMGETRDLDGSDDYYVAWVTTLERMVINTHMVKADGLEVMKSNWTQAFLRTPHGQPVVPDLPVDI